MELNGRHDLLEGILNILSEFFGLTRRNRRVLHLSLGSVGLELVNAIALVLATKDAIRDLVKKISQQAGVRLSALLQSTLEFVNLILGELVRDYTGGQLIQWWRGSKLTFTSDGVQEINTTKGTGDDGVNGAASTLELYLGITTDMRENITLAKLDQGKFAVVAVGKEVCRLKLADGP